MAATIKNVILVPMDVMPLTQEAFEIARKLPPEIQTLMAKYWQGYADGYSAGCTTTQPSTATP